jgi:hypothetical protein
MAMLMDTMFIENDFCGTSLLYAKFVREFGVHCAFVHSAVDSVLIIHPLVFMGRLHASFGIFSNTNAVSYAYQTSIVMYILVDKCVHKIPFSFRRRGGTFF